MVMSGLCYHFLRYHGEDIKSILTGQGDIHAKHEPRSFPESCWRFEQSVHALDQLHATFRTILQVRAPLDCVSQPPAECPYPSRGLINSNLLTTEHNGLTRNVDSRYGPSGHFFLLF